MPKQRHKKRLYVRAVKEAGQPDAVEVVEVCEDCQPITTRIVRRLNIARPICDFMLGENHPPQHRFAMGAIIMLAGVVVAKGFGHVPNVIIAHIGDLIGYGLHGFGLTPFIEHAVEKVKENRAKAEPSPRPRGMVQRE